MLQKFKNQAFGDKAQAAKTEIVTGDKARNQGAELAGKVDGVIMMVQIKPH